MPAVWTEAELLARGYRPDGSRVPAQTAGDPSAVERLNSTGSDRRAVVALRKPGATGESGLQRPANKYRAIRTEGLGPNGERRTYDSRKEARAARELNAEQSAGLIVSWVPQVSLPMGKDEKGRDVRYRADALAILQVNPDGTFVGRFVDVKGRDTSTSRAKRAALRALYQIDVKVI